MGRSATFHASAKNGLFCSYLHGSTATFELEHFWVRPADMSSGVGRALFEDASRMARAAGACAIQIASRKLPPRQPGGREPGSEFGRYVNFPRLSLLQAPT